MTGRSRDISINIKTKQLNIQVLVDPACLVAFNLKVHIITVEYLLWLHGHQVCWWRLVFVIELV